MSPATRARGQKRRTNGPHYFARVGTQRTAVRANLNALSLSLPLPLHILYTLYERAPQLLHMLLCGQILDISQGGDIKSAIARSGCGLGVRLTTVTNGRVLARLSPFGLITRGEKIER